MNINIEEAKNKFGIVLEEQLSRVEKLKKEDNWIDYSVLDNITIGMIGGDGIGPTISRETNRILEKLLE